MKTPIFLKNEKACWTTQTITTRTDTRLGFLFWTRPSRPAG